MCSVGATAPTNSQPQYVHNPYLDGGAYGNSVDANRIGTSALTIGLDPQAAKGAGPTGGLTIAPTITPVNQNPPGTGGNGGAGNGDGGGGNGGGRAPGSRPN